MDKWIAADWPAPATVVGGTTLRGGHFDELGLDGEPCWLEQVHGAEVVRAGQYPTPPKADGSVSRTPDRVCVVQTADCLPVLLCNQTGTVVAAAHAGWRGLAAGVIENAIAVMAVDPTTVMAWLGPAISQPSFEVGDEVRGAFMVHKAADSAFFERNARGRWQADLYGLARRRLVDAGVVQVYGGRYCTYRDQARFHSYRRDPGCGRMVSFVGAAAP
ncbi:MAG TPA: peptidoglycan editing factor PgeF [Woeseiaceae bacterium]|nr:peptidoglycan editing factor PgeF [Woeseiaceae bacterium]